MAGELASYLVDDEEMDVCCRPSVIFVVVVAWVVDLEDLLPIFFFEVDETFFSGRQTQQTFVFFRRLKVLFLSSPPKNVQFSKVFFAFCGQED